MDYTGRSQGGGYYGRPQYQGPPGHHPHAHPHARHQVPHGGYPMPHGGPRPVRQNQPGTSVYVGNLSWSTTWPRLKEFMSEIGHVAFADVLRDMNGRSKGCGIVVFGDVETANRAIAEMSGRELDGRQIMVREDREAHRFPRRSARPPAPMHRPSTNYTATFSGEMGSTVYVGGLPYSMTWQHLKDLMRKAGPVEHVEVMYDGNGMSKGCGLVRFATAEDAQNAIRMFNEQPLDGRNLLVRVDAEADKYRRGVSVHVGNLPWEVTWRELKDLMRPAGEVIHAEVMHDNNGLSRGWGIVRFVSADGANAAIEQFNEFEWLGRSITVRLDRREAERKKKEATAGDAGEGEDAGDDAGDDATNADDDDEADAEEAE
ncbi:hypothetical protein PTSG_05647 [Salpingoeca rosetta]|uniref:RRM domain-containing protein n=1 Tax=Salpingoeca rosetta (strain ATCC 50818 / BSB-021) TaxID=946362 RepID=F2UBT7_SALR5|nr:uncharacterized protein PTSG_05647 [Salpingoeca rosetta]EGD73953.1 hypothetical protein PTSG_05647 [Salpingoeca rosetta]|eukprot:XP_004993516.1 hypothetical protein PTSG_05647 [Salpingoeca rosetta]